MDFVTLSQILGNFGEFVGAIAVVATLFYLAVQVRQSKEATEANTRSIDESRSLAMSQAYQARADSIVRLNVQLASTPRWLELNMKMRTAQQDPVKLDAMLATLTEDELSILRTTETSKRTIMDSCHYQHQLGFLDNEYYESVFVPSIRAWAPTWKAIDLLANARSGFVTAIDEILGAEE